MLKDVTDANEVTCPTRHSFVIFWGRKWVAYFVSSLTYREILAAYIIIPTISGFLALIEEHGYG